MTDMKFELGTKAKDSVTGLQGTLTAFARYITGCDQYLIAPPVDKEGKHVNSRWYDANRIEAIEKKPSIKVATDIDKGPCEMAPIK